MRVARQNGHRQHRQDHEQVSEQPHAQNSKSGATLAPSRSLRKCSAATSGIAAVNNRGLMWFDKAGLKVAIFRAFLKCLIRDAKNDF